MTYPLHLHGLRVDLRDFTPDDVDGAAAIVGDDRVTRWLSFDSRDRRATARMLTAAMTAAGSRPRTEYYLAAVLSDGATVVGFARLALGPGATAKLGYAIHADHWGHGYATDAARTLVAYGFDHLGLHRITAAVGPDNVPSKAVLKHLGFTLEGRLRDHVRTNGAWRDSQLFSLLAHERNNPPAPSGVRSGRP
jgi:RimJ/RimL family protein N-acetyltransferase